MLKLVITNNSLSKVAKIYTAHLSFFPLLCKVSIMYKVTENVHSSGVCLQFSKWGFHVCYINCMVAVAALHRGMAQKTRWQLHSVDPTSAGLSSQDQDIIFTHQ